MPRTTRTQTAVLPFRVVTEYTRLVVFRLGRMTGVKGPGVVGVLPIADRIIRVDLREFYLEIPRQTAITKDNAPISIDFITFFKVVDVEASVVQVADFSGAAQNIAATTLRSVVGDISLDDMLAKRDEINQLLRAKLDETTERWGVKVTNVEIREITPPPAVQEAMTRQMSAERTRRAVVTETLDPEGQVRVRGETWAATLGSKNGDAPVGTKVVVWDLRGLTLYVTPVDHMTGGPSAGSITER